MEADLLDIMSTSAEFALLGFPQISETNRRGILKAAGHLSANSANHQEESKEL